MVHILNTCRQNLKCFSTCSKFFHCCNWSIQLNNANCNHTIYFETVCIIKLYRIHSSFRLWLPMTNNRQEINKHKPFPQPVHTDLVYEIFLWILFVLVFKHKTMNTISTYDEVLSGYQPGQMVEQWKNQHFKDHLCPRPQGTSLTVVFSDLSTIWPGW